MEDQSVILEDYQISSKWLYYVDNLKAKRLAKGLLEKLS